MALEAIDAPTDIGLDFSEVASRLRNAAAVYDSDKNSHLIEDIHGKDTSGNLIPRIGISRRSTQLCLWSSDEDSTLRLVTYATN